MIGQKLLPESPKLLYSEEAELGALGSAMLSRYAARDLIGVLKETDFHEESHQRIFRAIRQIVEAGMSPDLVTVSDALGESGIADIGGDDYLVGIATYVPSVGNSASYCNIVKEKAVKRAVRGYAVDIVNLVDREDRSAAELVEIAQSRASRLASGASPERTSEDAARDATKRLDAVLEGKGQDGHPTGLKELDKIIAPLERGQLGIAAARTSMGKTTWALSVAVCEALRGKKVLFCSFEQPESEIVDRFVASQTGYAKRYVTFALSQGGKRATEVYSAVCEALETWAALDIQVMDDSSSSTQEIRSRISSLGAKKIKPLVFIDHLTTLRDIESSENQNLRIAERTRTIKRIARELEVPIWLLCQLNRAVEGRANRRPTMADIRDCLHGGSLVLDADTGRRVPIGVIAEKGLRFNVWALDKYMRLVKRPIMDAWQTGTKEIFRVTTKSGRVISCSGGHRFLTPSGWTRLKDLHLGGSVGLPRRYEAIQYKSQAISGRKALLLGWLLGDGYLKGSPSLTVATEKEADFASMLGISEFGLAPNIRAEGRGAAALKVDFTTGKRIGPSSNRLTSWLREIGAWGYTGDKKHTPTCMFEQPNSVVAQFLRGLFHADGSLSKSGNSSSVSLRLSTISETLARDVQHLLLRFGINAFVKCSTRNIGGYRTSTKAIWTVRITERQAVCGFFAEIGFIGEKQALAASKVSPVRGSHAGQFDRIPIEFNSRVRQIRAELAVSVARSGGWLEQGKRMSRSSCRRLGGILGDSVLKNLGESDVLWDTLQSVESIGYEETFDLSVATDHNFCVDGFITHNSGSIEEIADVLIGLYRPKYYERNANSQDEIEPAEAIVIKQRNGETGTAVVAFNGPRFQFQDLDEADAQHYRQGLP